MGNVHALHAAASAPAGEPAAVQPAPAAPRVQLAGSRRLSPKRQASAARASRRIQLAITVAGSSQGACAKALEVHPSVVAEWCDEENAAALTLRDLELLPVGVQRAYHAARLAELDAGTPLVSLGIERRLRRLVSRCGQSAEATDEALEDDDTITPDEALAILPSVRGAKDEAAAIERELVAIVAGAGA